MTISEYRRVGISGCIRFAISECSLGSILVACSDRGICTILLGDDPKGLVHDLRLRFPAAEFRADDSGVEQFVAKVVDLVETPGANIDLPLDIDGTAFQRRVWQLLCEIPAGERVSYGDIANRLGKPKAGRAVARACAANPLAVAIPCHRVVRGDGSLSGYRWGLERKRLLLEREANTRETNNDRR